MSTDFDDSWQRRESPAKALVQIGIGTIIFGLAAGYYLWHAHQTNAVEVLVSESKELITANDVLSLKQARGKLEEALSIQGNHQLAVATAAKIDALLWAHHGVEHFRDSALDYVSRANNSNIVRTERYVASALIALAQAKPEEAIAQLTPVIKRGANSAPLFWVLGQAQRLRGELKVGRDNLRRAQESSSGAPHFAASLGDAYEEDGDQRNARLFWKNATVANGSYIPGAARHLIGRMRRGEPFKSLMQDILTLRGIPEDAIGRIDQAAIELAYSELMYQQGKAEEAVAAADTAISLGGESARHIFAKGRAQLAKGDSDLGFASIAAARSKMPKALRYFYGAADMYRRGERASDAVSLLQDATMKEQLADSPRYHTALGNALRDSGDIAASEKAYALALKLNEKYAAALLGQGIVSWKQKKYDKATEWFEKALAARGTFPEVYEALGLMWVEQGAAAQANPQLEVAEKGLKAAGTDAVRMGEFYGIVIKTLTDNREKSYLSTWVEREKQFRKTGI